MGAQEGDASLSGNLELSSTEDNGDHPNIFSSLCQPEIDWYTLFQQRWVYLNKGIIIWNLKLWQATCKTPHSKGRRILLRWGKGSWRAKGPWLFIGWVLAREEKSSSFWVHLWAQGLESSLFGHLALFEISIFFFFSHLSTILFCFLANWNTVLLHSSEQTSNLHSC